MSKQKPSEPISKRKLKGDSLSSLQTDIVKFLAENKPKTINEISKVLSKDYKSIYRSFDSLQKKKLVSEVDAKNYRGNKYALFWLSVDGMVLALLGGADHVILLENAKEIFPDLEIVHCFLEVMQLLDSTMLELAHDIVKKKGTIEFVELVTILFSGSLDADEEKMKLIVSVLKKYPDQYDQLKILIRAIIEKLNQLIAD